MLTLYFSSAKKFPHPTRLQAFLNCQSWQKLRALYCTLDRSTAVSCSRARWQIKCITGVTSNIYCKCLKCHCIGVCIAIFLAPPLYILTAEPRFVKRHDRTEAEHEWVSSHCAILCLPSRFMHYLSRTFCAPGPKYID